jgi:hypothetical protein
VYRHTQRSRGAAVTFAALAVLLAGLAWTDPVLWPLMLAVGVLLAWMCWIGRRMTIEVAEGELRAWFGSGWPRYSWPLERIAAVRTVHNPFWYGAGIRFTPRGMLYNVASGPGIEFRLKSGATFRLGSDDAEALAAAIRSAAHLEAPEAQRPPDRALSTAP